LRYSYTRSRQWELMMATKSLQTELADFLVAAN
jgi:hypothetical protein